MEIYKKYRELAINQDRIHFGGRLAEYKYYDMNIILEKVLKIIM